MGAFLHTSMENHVVNDTKMQEMFKFINSLVIMSPESITYHIVLSKAAVLLWYSTCTEDMAMA